MNTVACKNCRDLYAVLWIKPLMRGLNMAEAIKGRKIRYKEWGLNYTFDAQITQDHIDRFDDSMQLGSVEISTDNNGFIKTGNNLELEGRKPILVIGASFVESMLLEPVNRFPSVFEAELEEIYPGKFQVWNAGYSAMTPLHMLNKLASGMRPLFPKLAGVVLFVPTVDQGIIGRKHSYWDQDEIVSPVLPLAESLDFPEEAFDGFKDQAILWELIIRLLQSYDVPVITGGSAFRRSAWQDDPFWQKSFRHPDQPVGAINYIDRIVDNALAVAVDLGTPIMDSRDWECMHTPNHEYFYDLLHLNNEGGRVFGKEMARQVAEIDVF